MFGIVAERICEMLVILLVGVAVYKLGIIDETASKKLSDLLLTVVAPLLLFQSYQTDFDLELFYGLLEVAGASLLISAVGIFAAKFLFPGRDDRGRVEKMAAIYSNCGFIGIPLVDGILGSRGVFYMTAYLTVFNVLFWTHGLSIMDRKGETGGGWKKIFNPSVIGILLGVLCFVARVRLPEVLLSPITMVGNMNTPLAMMIAGISLAQGDIRRSLKNKRLYLLTLTRLVAYPMMGLLILWPMQLEFTMAFTVFVGTACPMAAATILFAQRYDGDARYATELFVVTTALSAVTIPLLSIPATWLLQ